MNALRRSPRAEGGIAAARRRARRLAGQWLPWLLLAPGLAWLVVWFLLPLAALPPMALAEPLDRFRMVFRFSWRFDNLSEVLGQYGPILLRSFHYAGLATAMAVVIAYPLAWLIRFRGGRWKGVLLGMVVVPYFTSYLVRAIAWTSLLGDEGPLLRVLRAVAPAGVSLADGLEALGVLKDGRLLHSAGAVIGGLTYNMLPFMVLPIAVSMERIDPAWLEAAEDLRAGALARFRRLVLPLTLPGLGAGLVLSLIPAAGDVVNPRFLGGPNDQMVGNVIQNLMLVQRQLPKAAALALLLMTLMAAAVLAQWRRFGVQDLGSP